MAICYLSPGTRSFTKPCLAINWKPFENTPPVLPGWKSGNQDIPRGIDMYVDVLRISKEPGKEGWHFMVEQWLVAESRNRQILFERKQTQEAMYPAPDVFVVGAFINHPRKTDSQPLE
jgi:hypothetical protein